MNRSRTREPALTDYVRDRLDHKVGRGRARPGDVAAETGLKTVVRPRPTLVSQLTPVPRATVTPRADVPSSADGPTAGPEASEPTAAETGSPAWPVRFTRRHLMVVAILLALGALIAGYALTRAKAVPATPVVIESAGPSPVSEPATAAPTPTTQPVRVHVVGEVHQPGVHALPQGSRVVEAIEAAGGLTPAAKPGALNLAQVLVDGQQVVVGDAKNPSEIRGTDGVTSAGGGSGPGKVNLNTATQAQLESLPGVGPVTAEKIITWRTQHGRFTRIEELQEVPGIGPKSFAELTPHISV